VNEFSVYQFFRDETHERVHVDVSGQEALAAFYRLIASPGARTGTTRRVIIIDGGDCTNFEWRHGEGVVFPRVMSEFTEVSP
jgi:hypothetical protein